MKQKGGCGAHINLKEIIFCFIFKERTSRSPNICKENPRQINKLASGLKFEKTIMLCKFQLLKDIIKSIKIFKNEIKTTSLLVLEKCSGTINIKKGYKLMTN